MYKSDSECRREREKKFERNRWGENENPYSKYGSYNEERHHRSWDDGFNYAKRRDKERRVEEETREREEQCGRYEAEKEQRRQEEKYYAQREEEEEQERLQEGPEET